MKHLSPRPVLVIAHRGASRQAPENTKAAIQQAMASRVEMIELDVQLTHDNRLVIFHDDRLERTTTGQGRLQRTRYRDLARLDCGSWFAPRFSGERILLVSQAIRLIPPPLWMNLELKRTPRASSLVLRLVRLLRWSRAVSRVLVSSFDAALLADVRSRLPRITRALLCRRHPNFALRAAVSLGCSALHPHASLVTAGLVHAAHARGLRVHVWTVDRPREARRLIRLGVDGLFTNTPARLRKILPAPHGGTVG